MTVQPAPQQNDYPDILKELIKRIEERRLIGLETYGTPLQPFNGRNSLEDLLAELLDGAAYTLQKITEHSLAKLKCNKCGTPWKFNQINYESNCDCRIPCKTCNGYGCGLEFTKCFRCNGRGYFKDEPVIC